MKFRKPVKAIIKTIDGIIKETLVEVDELSKSDMMMLGTKMYMVTSVSKSQIKLEEFVPFGEIIPIIGKEINGRN